MPYGYDHKFVYSHLGYNLKPTDMQAAIGVSQLDKVDDFIAARNANVAGYMRAFRDAGLDEHFILPEATPNSEPSWFGFFLTIRDDSPLDRRDLLSHLEDMRIGSRPLFSGNIIYQPAFEGVEYRVFGDLTNTHKIMNDSFWLGCWPGISSDQIAYVTDSIVDYLRKNH